MAGEVVSGPKDCLSRLADLAVYYGAISAAFSARDVVVVDWVRSNAVTAAMATPSKFHAPHAPSPEETRRMLSELDHALSCVLTMCREGRGPRRRTSPRTCIPGTGTSSCWLTVPFHMLEKTAFYDGFYTALGFGAYPCIYCEHCVAEEAEGAVDGSMQRGCSRHMDMAMIGMEAAGMDVFATARKVGWDIRTIMVRDLEYGKVTRFDIVSVGSLLLERDRR